MTGSTGRLGGRVARRLAAGGIAQRLVVRDSARAPRLPAAGVTSAAYGDVGASRRALAGATTLFMVSAQESTGRVDEHKAFVDAAAAAGVQHIVYTSFFGAAPDATFHLARHHHATEQHIRASGLRWTFLRDNLYLDELPRWVGPDGVIRGPAGDGRVAGVAIDDIADVAAAVLKAPDDHAGRTYDLTGPAAITLDEAAEAMTAATGRTVTYHAETVEEAFTSRAHLGAPGWMVEAWVSTYTAIAAGEMERVTGDVERVAGHPPMSFARLLSRADG